MWPFKRKIGSAQEIVASERPDDEIRDIAWAEFDKEAELEASNLGTAVLGPLSLTAAIRGLRSPHGRRESPPDDEKT